MKFTIDTDEIMKQASKGAAVIGKKAGELQDRKEEFTALTENAFADDFRNRLRGSVKLAADAGVKEEDILHSADEIDDFFLN